MLKLPATVRKEIIKRIFKEGIESASKEELESLFKKGVKKLYRLDYDPEELFKIGFDPKKGKVGVAGLKPGQEPGIYWAPTKKDLSYFIKESLWKNPPKEFREKRLIEGIAKPGLKEGEGLKTIKRPGFTEVVQTEPKKVLAKWGDKYRILGLAGALGGAGMALEPKEAEALPIGKMMPAKDLAKELSSSSKALEGKQVFGKTVKKITMGKGDWRDIVFTDRTKLPVTKDVLHQLCREVGTAKYMQDFALKDTPSQLSQAVRSLEFHRQRQKNLATRKEKDEWRRLHEEQVRVAGQKTVPYVYVESEGFYMPEKYAKVLEVAGVVKIKKK